MQDPHDENFEEGEVNVEKPVYGPTMSLITKIFGETRTVVVSGQEFYLSWKIPTYFSTNAVQ